MNSSCKLLAPRKLRLFSSPSCSDSSSSSQLSSLLSESIETSFSHLRLHDVDPMFSEEAEQRINDWLDEQNILQIQPEQHFRDFFQSNKDIVSQQLFMLNILSDQTNNCNNSDDAKSDGSLMTSSTGSLDLKKSPILARRCITLLEPNVKSSLIRK